MFIAVLIMWLVGVTHVHLIEDREPQGGVAPRETHIALDVKLAWLHCPRKVLDRSCSRVEISPIWREVPSNLGEYRRFVRREVWVEKGYVVYRHTPACAVDDQQLGDEASGCMEILFRSSSSAEWPPWNVWAGFRGDRIKIGGDYRDTPVVTVKNLMGSFLSDVVFYSETIALRVRESSRIRNRNLTTKWIDELREYCTHNSPSRLAEFKKFLERGKSDLASETILLEEAEYRGFYDLRGFVSGDKVGIIYVRIFDLDLDQYIDTADYQDTYEVVGGGGRKDLASYWNCYVRIRCKVCADEKAVRNVRLELYLSPPSVGAPNEKLADIEIIGAACWRF